MISRSTVIIAAMVFLPLTATAQDDASHAVIRGLAGEMTKAADGLAAGERYDATRALDRALHLAEFAADAGGGPFLSALEAVERARHELQMGRPESARKVLSEGGASLDAAESDIGLRPASKAGDIEGRPLLDAQGRKLGEIDEVDDGLARVESGGFLFLGGEAMEVALDDLHAGGGFVVQAGNGSP